MTGLGTVLRIQTRTTWRRGLVWVLVLAGSLAGTAASIASLYDTPEKIRTYADATASDALVAINGRVEGIGTLGGVVQDEFGFMASFLLPLLGLGLVAGLTRREEESGRLEHLLGGRLDRRAPVVGALLVVLAVVLAVVVLGAASLAAGGVATDRAVLYAAALGLLALVFAALAALLAQVVQHARAVYAGGLAVLGAAYVLRGVGDVLGSGAAWLSPLVWVERASPFADRRWWVLAVPAVVSLALAVAAVVLAGRRDVGSALWRPAPGSPRASGRLLRPVGLALSIHRGAIAGWLVGAVVLAGVMGALAQQAVEALLGNPAIAGFMAPGGGDPADAFLAVVEVYLAVLACGYVVQALGVLRQEEAQGRVEPLLAGTTSRWGWLGAHLVVVLAGLAAVVLGSALVLGVSTAWSTGDAGYVASLLGAGAAYLPAVLVVAGVAVVLYGLVPRLYVLAWAAFGLVAFVAFLGAGLRMPQWMLDLAPTTHVGNPPQGAVAVTALVVLGALAAALVVVGAAAFRRRTVPAH